MEFKFELDKKYIKLNTSSFFLYPSEGMNFKYSKKLCTYEI